MTLIGYALILVQCRQLQVVIPNKGPPLGQFIISKEKTNVVFFKPVKIDMENRNVHLKLCTATFRDANCKCCLKCEPKCQSNVATLRSAMYTRTNNLVQCRYAMVNVFNTCILLVQSRYKLVCHCQCILLVKSRYNCVKHCQCILLVQCRYKVVDHCQSKVAS